MIIPIIWFIRDWYVQTGLQRLAAIKYDAMKEVLQKLASSSNVSAPEVEAIAMKPSLRIILYRALEAFGHQEMFPKDFYTEEKGAESYLVNWLEFPTELGRPPDMIMLMKIVTLELDVRVHYYVFKFKTTAPSWASKFGWMMGVCGPYNQSSLPFDVPERVFSRFNPVGLLTPDAEVTWVHESINGNFKKAP